MNSLTGQLLISMPQMSDPFFARSVVYLCTHREDNGAMGLIINRAVEAFTLRDLYAKLEIESAANVEGAKPVHFGGPVAPTKGFVLHSADYREEGTLIVDDRFSLTASLDILRAKGRGAGPAKSLVAVGYAGWGTGQLESEIEANGWLLVEADLALVFETENDRKWQQALAKLGVSPEMLSGESGRA
jgi:putative transcriptional regulator